MKPKITYFFIAIFIIFWIVFLGWGMLKTTLKLTREKTPAAGITGKKEQGKITPEAIKTEEAATALTTDQAETRPILVRAFKVKATDFHDVLPVMGTVKGKTEIELKFEINGVVKSINFREGQKIQAGDLIASLNPKDTELRIAYAKNKFNSAQAAYNSVQKKLEVHQKLYDVGAIIKSKLEEVALECESTRFQVETARSEMELAENELNKTSLYATKDGVMGPREAEEGEFVTPQDKLGSLLEIKEVFVEVGVVERDIDKIKLGQKAKVYVDAYPNVNFEGKVEYIFPVIEGKSRTLTAKIQVPNPDALLLPGMFSRVEISIVELKNALIVPSTCLISTGVGSKLAPVIPASSILTGEDGAQTGVVYLNQVSLGYFTSDYAQVFEGLGVNDLVVIEAQGELKDRGQVKIVGIEEGSF